MHSLCTQPLALIINGVRLHIIPRNVLGGFPGIVFCAFIAVRLAVFLAVLPGKRTVAAERHQAHGKQLARLFVPALEEGGAEAYGKFVYFKAEQFARGIVAELVHGYHDEQYEYCKQYRAYCAQNGRYRK